MPCLVGAHRFDEGAGARILGGKVFEMPRKVLFDLPLGLRKKAEIPPVSERTGDAADGECAGVPERVQQAGTAAELPDPLLAPGEVVLFLPRRALEGLAGMPIPRCQRLALIERLRTHFPDVVHAHQRRRVPAVTLGELDFGVCFGGGRPARIRNAADRAQSAIELGDQSVNVDHPARVTPEKKRAPCGARLDDLLNLTA